MAKRETVNSALPARYCPGLLCPTMVRRVGDDRPGASRISAKTGARLVCRAAARCGSGRADRRAAAAAVPAARAAHPTAGPRTPNTSVPFPCRNSVATARGNARRGEGKGSLRQAARGGYELEPVPVDAASGRPLAEHFTGDRKGAGSHQHRSRLSMTEASDPSRSLARKSSKELAIKGRCSERLSAEISCSSSSLVSGWKV